MSNDLIAAPEDQTHWYTGLGIAESIADIVSGVESENWVEAGIGIFATAAEAAAWATDPFGQLIQYGVSWLMEHLQPLRDALDWLAGDPPQIEAYGQTWRNVSTFVNTTATTLLDRSRADTAGWQGTAAGAYRNYTAALAQAVADTAKTAELIGYVVSIAGALVAAVRELVRDLIAELVAILVERAWLWAAETATGIGAPAAQAQITALVAKWVGKVARVIAKLCRSLNNLKGLTDKLDEIWDLLRKAWKRFRDSDKRGADQPTTKDPIAGPNHKVPDAVRSPDGTKPSDGQTSPSGATSPAGNKPGTGTDSPGKPDTTSPNTTTPSGSLPDTRTSPQRSLHRHGQADDNRQPWPPERRDPQLQYTPNGELARTQQNIRRIMEKYGIRLDRGGRPRPDNSLRGADGETRPRGRNRDMRIGPSAFVNEEMLARALYHENVHVRQINANGGRGPGSVQQWDEWEKAAHAADREWWQNHPLNPDRPGGGA